MDYLQHGAVAVNALIMYGVRKLDGPTKFRLFHFEPVLSCFFSQVLRSVVKTLLYNNE